MRLPALVDPRTGGSTARSIKPWRPPGPVVERSQPAEHSDPHRTRDGASARRSCRHPGHRLISADYSQVGFACSRTSPPTDADRGFPEERRRPQCARRRSLSRRCRRGERGPAPRRQVINFGIIYGMGPARLAKELGISFEEAETYIANLLRAHPGVSQYIRSTLEGARRPATYRRCLHPALHPTSPARRGVRQFAERMAVNTLRSRAPRPISSGGDGADRSPPRRGGSRRRRDDPTGPRRADSRGPRSEEGRPRAWSSLVREEMEGAAQPRFRRSGRSGLGKLGGDPLRRAARLNFRCAAASKGRGRWRTTIGASAAQ